MIELLLILLLFFSLLIGLPILITFIKARRKSAYITLQEAWGITLRNTGKGILFEALSNAQKNNICLCLTQLETHMLSGGNPQKVVDALVKNKTNSDVSFQMLSALDLMGKDLKESLRKGSEVHIVLIKGLEFSNFKLDYEARYKYGISIVFRDEGDTDLKKKIEAKLHQVSQNWPSKDPLQTQNFLRQNVLNNEYWEKVLNVNLVDQNLQIKI